MTHDFQSDPNYAISGTIRRLQYDHIAAPRINSRAEWRAWRSDWRRHYADLSANIRQTKSERRAARGDKQSELQSRREFQRNSAANMMLLRKTVSAAPSATTRSGNAAHRNPEAPVAFVAESV